MKVLVIGPSGSGKTFVSRALQSLGINAFDADDIEDLSAWYDQNRQKVASPKSAAEAFSNHYSFLWDKKFLKEFLNNHPDVYLFGGSGNVWDMFSLFDRVYFLKVEPKLQKERLRSHLRKKPEMDCNEDGLVVWGSWFEEEAKKQHIPFIDASQTPEEIFEIISKKDW